MPDFELEGYTLGEKHKNYNNLLNDAVKNNKIVDAKDFTLHNSDVINLLNIDIASHNKDVEYILKVLTCEDMLYVSRAIKQSNWLINGKDYIHIINPKYLAENIYPQMCTKAIYKFIKHIRENLNDEERAEEFYNSEENLNEAVKWLPRCSLEFIDAKFINHVKHVKTTLLKRLCERSINVLEIYVKNEEATEKRKVLRDTIFLLSTHTEKYLDLVETMPNYQYPTFNHKATRIIMKSSSERVIEKFENYYNFVHLPTFIKYLKQENIKDFLLSQAQKLKGNNLRRFFNLKRLLLFIKLIPEKIRFDFVTQVFIEKVHENKDFVLTEYERKGMNILCDIAGIQFCHLDHIWYQFAPFDVALAKVKELMATASSINQKIALLEVLLTSAQSDLIHTRAFLEYLRDKQSNAEYHVKVCILKKILTENNFLRYDPDTWNILNDIFKSMNIYKELQDQHLFIEAIIIYRVIHNEKVPEIIENNFNFNSLVFYHKKLTEQENEMLFKYLFGIMTKKLSEHKNITNDVKFKEKLSIIEQAFYLLKDFKKELQEYPILIIAVKDLIQIKKELSLTISMIKLFNIKKSWRKLFFEESLIISPTESVIFNALKHGPSIIEQDQKVFQAILNNDSMCLRRVLDKIKIYWSNSFAKNITATYIDKLSVLGGHKATTRGLSVLLSKTDLQELITKYAPKEAKVNWEKVNEVELSIQQQFAKNMHIARPQPSPEIIICFAKGDYLQYALPSLLSIFYNLNCLSSRLYIPNLLNAPVSLQKHGIRLAVSKMNLEELLTHFSNIWKNNKNASIRTVMFKNVFKLLCKEKDPIKIFTIWQLIKMFLDNLTFEEDEAIYKLLFKVEDLPIEIRGDFYMKCYKFLRKIVNSNKKYERYKTFFDNKFMAYAATIIERLDPDFIDDIILDFAANDLTMGPISCSGLHNLNLIALHLLVAANEEIQLKRFNKILLPILKQLFSVWNSQSNGVYFIREILKTILNRLRHNMKNNDFSKKMMIPQKIFILIQKELENSLSVPENYMLLTTWKLNVIFVTVLNSHQPIDNWQEACTKVADEFGNRCNDYLREDCNKYFPRIYLLFVRALKNMLDDFVPKIIHFDIYKRLIQNEDFVHGYLAAIQLISQYSNIQYTNEKEVYKIKIQELCKCISVHPSTEVIIHYYDKMEIMLPV